MISRRMDGEQTPGPPEAPVEAREPPAATPRGSGLVAWLPRRRTWLLLGRTLGGFGAFLAAIIAATQFAFGGDDGPGGGSSTSAAPSDEPYSYVERHDASGRISVEVPTAWGNVDGGAWAPRNIARLEGLGTIAEARRGAERPRLAGARRTDHARHLRRPLRGDPPALGPPRSREHLHVLRLQLRPRRAVRADRLLRMGRPLVL